MMHLIAKIGLASTVSAGALTVALFYLATIEDGSDAKFLFRMGVTAAIAGLVIGVVTCALRRQDKLEHDLEIDRRHANADRQAMLNEIRDLSQEFGKFRDDMTCRMMMTNALNEDDQLLRSIFDSEEN